jgi:hypothetical protein
VTAVCRGPRGSDWGSCLQGRNRTRRSTVGTVMRRRLTLLAALAAPFVLAGCGKGKY